MFTIANQNEFPPDWVNYMKKLSPTGSVVSYHALNEINPFLINKSFVFIERNVDFEGNDVVGMIDFKMNYMTGMAPKKKVLVQSYVICSPKEAHKKEKTMELADIIDKQLSKLVPDFTKHVEWCMYNTIWHLDGVAKTIDCKKPSIVTPIKNLYLAGDCVNSKGVGINCAADSAQLVLQRLSKKE
jgi:phytoene dehydrogenase-like protein